ncbi:hypothetical protein CPT_Morttis_048 [Acinetobacter phage Morttis]|nr:hypothetical protein CPT_Morttis_048 [Acinetobacter phage Morttis]
MMTPFEVKEQANKEIQARARTFIDLAIEAIAELTKHAELDEYPVPHFVQSYRGFHLDVIPFENTYWVDNPNYVPNQTSEFYLRPENIEKQAGFSQIQKSDKVVNLQLVEVQDSWDDYRGDPETWNISLIPEELFWHGTKEQILKLFEDRFKEQIDRQIENEFQSKWSQLFYYFTPEELIKSAEAMKAIRDSNPEQPWNSVVFERYLDIMRDKYAINT